jgi:hypothetical protein
MSLISDNIKRHEIKFVINSKEKDNFIIKNNLKNLFPDRVVESIYFDTKDLKFFNLSEEGVTPRLKIRLRGYNNNKLNNLEIKKTKNHHREKIILKDFEFDDFSLHSNLRKIGINNIVQEKIRVKYLRSYYQLENLGRITMDRNIEFLHSNRNFHNSKKINQIVLEVKIQSDKIDKNKIEKIINFKESRFSKYCEGMNILQNSN